MHSRMNVAREEGARRLVIVERSAQVVCTLAAYVVETVGTQEYSFTPEQFLSRVHDSYGSDAAIEIGKYLG